MLEVSCSDVQKVLVTLNPITQSGKPAKIDGAVAVEVQSGDATFEVQADGLSFFVISANPGDTSYLVSADADLGAGVENISDVVLLHVAGEKAVNLGLSAGAPEAK